MGRHSYKKQLELFYVLQSTYNKLCKSYEVWQNVYKMYAFLGTTEYQLLVVV